MSPEDQYDAWVRGLMGGKKYAATSVSYTHLTLPTKQRV